MENFNIAEDALKTSLDSEGSASTELSKWQKSLDAKLLQLKASWQSFAQTFMSSDFLKGAIDGLTGLVNVLEKLIDNFGILGTVGMGAVGKGIFDYIKNGSKEAAATLDDLLDELKEIKSAANSSSIPDIPDADGTSYTTSSGENVVQTTNTLSNSAEAVSSVTDATSNMANAVEDTADAVIEVGDSVSYTTDAMSDMTETTSDVVDTVTDIADTTTDAIDSVSDVGDAISDIGNAADNISDVTEAMSDMSNTASNVSETVSDVVDAVTDVADVGDEIEEVTKKINTMSDVGESKFLKMGMDSLNISDTVDDFDDDFDDLFIKIADEASEATEAISDTVDIMTDMTDMADTATDVVDTVADIGDAISDVTDTVADVTDAVTDVIDTASDISDVADTVSDTIDIVEDLSDTVSDTVDIVDDVVDIVDGAADAMDGMGGGVEDVVPQMDDLGRTTTKTTSSLKAFMKTPMGIATALGVAAIAIGLIINSIKKYREEASKDSQEIIKSSDSFLDSYSTFEQAYIKYSGKTNLTSEEEAELASAINGTVEALDNKSSALQGVVNQSKDYVAYLERIATEENIAAERAANNKRDEAEEELRRAVFYDAWGKELGGNRVGVSLGTDEDSDFVKIAKDMNSKYLIKTNYSSDVISSVGFDFQLKGDRPEDIVAYYDTLVAYRDKLSDSSIDNLINTKEYKEVTAAIDLMSDSIDTYIEGVYEAAAAHYKVTEGIPKTLEDYMNMREAILSSEDVKGLSFATKKEIAGSLDSEYKQSFDLSDAEAQARSLIGLIDGYGKWRAGKVEAFLNLRTSVNNGEVSVGEYVSQFDDIKKLSDGWTDDEKKEFNLAFGLDSDKVKEQYDEMLRTLSRGMSEDAAKEFLNGLTAAELSAAISLKGEVDWENGSPAEILAQIREEAERQEILTFTFDIALEKEKLDNLSAALSEAVSGTGLSTEGISIVTDMFSDLEGYDPSKLLERTAHGIRLNTQEFSRLNDDYAKTNIDKLNAQMSTLGDMYNETREELYSLTYGTDEYNKKLGELDGIEAQIRELETLGSQYDALASSYNQWQMAEAAGSQRDMYETVIGGWETMDDEIKRGWIDDGTIEFLELLTNKTGLAALSAEELKEVYKGLDEEIKYRDKDGNVLENTGYSIRDFFTVDEDGNSTSQGVHNFLDAIGKLEEEAFGGLDVVERDENEKVIGFDFQLAGGDEVVAEALGVSVELVQIMKRAADDAGFVVSMDGTYQQLDVLKEKAQAAANELKNTFKVTDHEFNLESTDKDTILKDYDEALKIWEGYAKFKKADGTINMDREGAEEAFTLVSTLQSMVDKLAEPVYMKIDTTQIEKEMQEPVSKLQEYEELIKTEHQLKLKGTDTSGIEKDKEELINYFATLEPEVLVKLGFVGEEGQALTQEYLDSLPDEKKIELGFVDENGKPLTDINDVIENKLETGDLKLDLKAEIDIQTEMNQSLRDMVNIALYNAGLIDDEELSKRINIDLYAGEVDTKDVENEIDTVLDESNVSKDQEVVIKAFAEVFGIDDIEDLRIKLTYLDDKTIQAIATVFGQIDVEKLKNTFNGLDDKTVQAIAKALGEGDVNGLKTIINGLDDKTVQAIAEAFGYSDVDELNKAIDNLDPKTVQAIADVFGIKDVDSLRSAIKRLTGKNVKAIAKVSGAAAVSSLKKTISGLKSKTVTIWAQIKKKASDLWNKLTGGDGDSEANGTANVNGTAHAHGTVYNSGKAFKQGDWRTKKSETALTGELGQELVVTGNRWYTIGDNGAEFARIPKGSIVFNHKQTEELFKNGKVTSNGGRGRILANGTAFLEGTAYNSITGGGLLPETDSYSVGKETSSSSNNNNSDNDKSKKEAEEEAKEFEETFDWIEIAINRIERAIDQLDKKASSVYKSWGDRNSALTSQISKVGEEIDLQQKAYDKYMSEASKVGLSSSYISKIKDGTINIETIKDEDLAEKIQKYQEYYEKALECKNAIEELKETEASLFKQKFDNISTQYEGLLSVIEHEKNMLDSYISQSEAQAWFVSEKYYDALIKNQNSTISKLKQEQSALMSELKSSLSSGKIASGSEAYYEMVNAIDDVTLAIAESQTAILEYQQTIQQLSWERFDLLQEKISSITEEADFLIELLSSDKLFDDNGKLTDEGMSTMGLHGQNYNVLMYQADLVSKEAARLKKELNSDPFDTQLEERYREMLSLQQEYILAANNQKEAIRDLVEEGIDLELDSLTELIDKYTEALDSQKD